MQPPQQYQVGKLKDCLSRMLSNWTVQKKGLTLISTPDTLRMTGFVFRACNVMGMGSVFDIGQEVRQSNVRPKADH